MILSFLLTPGVIYWHSLRLMQLIEIRLKQIRLNNFSECLSGHTCTYSLHPVKLPILDCNLAWLSYNNGQTGPTVIVIGYMDILYECIVLSINMCLTLM